MVRVGPSWTRARGGNSRTAVRRSHLKSGIRVLTRCSGSRSVGARTRWRFPKSNCSPSPEELNWPIDRNYLGNMKSSRVRYSLGVSDSKWPSTNKIGIFPSLKSPKSEVSSSSNSSS